jgi:hypothetical protein
VNKSSKGFINIDLNILEISNIAKNASEFTGLNVDIIKINNKNEGVTFIFYIPFMHNF